MQVAPSGPSLQTIDWVPTLMLHAVPVPAATQSASSLHSAQMATMRTMFL